MGHWWNRRPQLKKMASIPFAFEIKQEGQSNCSIRHLYMRCIPRYESKTRRLSEQTYSAELYYKKPVVYGWRRNIIYFLSLTFHCLSERILHWKCQAPTTSNSTRTIFRLISGMAIETSIIMTFLILTCGKAWSAEEIWDLLLLQHCRCPQVQAPVGENCQWSHHPRL